MPLIRLKAINQDTWLYSGGGPEAQRLCYYMCSFIESDQGPWNNPSSFAQARTNAQNFRQGTEMMNYAKAKTLRKAPVLGRYDPIVTALESNRIQRSSFLIWPNGEAPGDCLHEIIIITGSNNDIIYFDPNFGFYQPTHPNSNNREALEYHIAYQYEQRGYQVAQFAYLNVRSNASSTPKGYV